MSAVLAVYEILIVFLKASAEKLRANTEKRAENFEVLCSVCCKTYEKFLIKLFSKMEVAGQLQKFASKLPFSVLRGSASCRPPQRTKPFFASAERRKGIADSVGVRENPRRGFSLNYCKRLFRQTEGSKAFALLPFSF